MSDARRFIIAGFVTLGVLLFVVGAPMIANHVISGDNVTHHISQH